MTRLRSEVDRLALELAWGQWRELGVGYAPAKHRRHAIDLEPLIVFTSGLDSDTRLRASSIDWCITNARFTSTLRLRHFAALATPRTQNAFGRFAATVNVHSSQPWPGHGDPYVLQPGDHRQATPDLRRPSLIQLRLRSVVGVSARAEILKGLLAADVPQPASVLAEASGHTVGRINQALDMLALSGILRVEPVAGGLAYHLADPRDLGGLLGWLPADYPDWQAIFRVFERIVGYAGAAAAPAPERLRSIDALLAGIDADLRRLGEDPRAHAPAGAGSVPDFEEWAVGFLSAHVQGRKTAPERLASYLITRESAEAWTVVVMPAGASRLPRDPFSGGALEVADSMFRDALDGDASRETWNAVCTEFAGEVLRTLVPGHSTTYTAEFVRRWFGNRRRRFDPAA